MVNEEMSKEMTNELLKIGEEAKNMAPKIFSIAFKSSKKITIALLKSTIGKYLDKHTALGSTNQMSYDKLSKKYDGLKNIEISDSNIKGFEKVARKYNIDFALKKDATTTPPTHIVFFKGKDMETMDRAFKEFVGKSQIQSKKPSIIETLNKNKAKIAEITKFKALDKTKNLEKVASKALSR